MAITDKDVKKLEQVFATKKELKQEFSEFESRFDKKFATKAEHNALEKRVEAGFTYSAKRFQDIDDRFDRMEDSLKTFRDEIFTLMDGYMARTEVFIQEQTMLVHKTDRLEGWTRKIATETHVKLPE